MRILIGHNYYQQYGGEDVVAKQEVELLRSQGHEVLFVEFHNKIFNQLSFFSKIHNILSWHWSSSSYQEIRKKCLEFRPDVAHFHNTFFMMTPSVYAACHSVGVPVVQTLHNFRLLCSNGLFFRQGKTCEECLDHSLLRGVKHGCYHHSRILTSAVVKMLQEHRKRQTWKKDVDAFIVLNNFSRKKFEQGGLAKEKIWVKPNFISQDPGIRCDMSDYFVFAGRLSEEKGIMTLIKAFRELPHSKLVVIGDGPLRAPIETYISNHQLTNITLTGFLEKNAYFDVFKKAKAVILPSLCYENFPMTIVEAFACGIGVIASQHGAMQEIVQEGLSGLFFKPGDSQDLKNKINSLEEDPKMYVSLGIKARQQYEEEFTAQKTYCQLLVVYEQAKLNLVQNKRKTR